MKADINLIISSKLSKLFALFIFFVAQLFNETKVFKVLKLFLANVTLILTHFNQSYQKNYF